MNFFQKHRLPVFFVLGFVAAFFLFVFLFNSSFFSAGRFAGSDSYLSIYPGGTVQHDAMPYSSDYETSQTETAKTEGDDFVSKDRMIIKNASLTLIVDNSEARAEDVREIAEQMDGYVESSDTRGFEQEKQVEIRLRIPTSNFDLVLREIKDLAVQVSRERMDVQDVGEEYTDLQARLSNLRASEVRFLQIFEEADTVEEILQVERELGRVRGEIERIEGVILHMERRVEMSTINLSLVSESEIEILGITWSPFREVKIAYNSLLESLVEFARLVIRFVFVLPLIVLWAVAIFLLLIGFLKLYKAFRRRYGANSFSESARLKKEKLK